MTMLLRRAGAILWFVFGFAGLGVLVGFLWLDRALHTARSGAPAMVLADVESQAPCVLPTTIDAFHRARRASLTMDLRAHVRDVLRCARNDVERHAFIDMLRDAATADDTLASQGLDAIARENCVALVAVSTGSHETSSIVDTCVDLAMHPWTTQSDDAEARARTLRVAQQLALIEAGVATEEVTAAFCTDSALLPDAVRQQIAAMDPTFTATVERVCGVHTADDAGVEDE